MLKQINLKFVFSCLGLALLFCAPSYAQQQQDEKPRVTREPARKDAGVAQAPDFAQENLSRVAASSAQIRAVLAKDEGLLVELKRWVAKEASDNGQVVEDSESFGPGNFRPFGAGPGVSIDSNTARAAVWIPDANAES